MHDTVSAPAHGLDRLGQAATGTALEEVCRRHGVRVLTVFGSAARGEPDPRDLDVGVLFEVGTRPDVVGLINDLAALAGTGAVDIAILNHGGPVIRERALVGAVGLYESERGALATAAMAATLERMDTRWMRDLDLLLMAGDR